MSVIGLDVLAAVLGGALLGIVGALVATSLAATIKLLRERSRPHVSVTVSQISSSRARGPSSAGTGGVWAALNAGSKHNGERAKEPWPPARGAEELTRYPLQRDETRLQ